MVGASGARGPTWVRHRGARLWIPPCATVELAQAPLPRYPDGRDDRGTTRATCDCCGRPPRPAPGVAPTMRCGRCAAQMPPSRHWRARFRLRAHPIDAIAVEQMPAFASPRDCAGSAHAGRLGPSAGTEASCAPHSALAGLPSGHPGASIRSAHESESTSWSQAASRSSRDSDAHHGQLWQRLRDSASGRLADRAWLHELRFDYAQVLNDARHRSSRSVAHRGLDIVEPRQSRG